MTNEDFKTWSSGLTSDQLAHFGASFTAQAAERRRCQITEAEAWEAYLAVDDIEGWTWSGFIECGRVRKACEILIGWRGHHPEQVAPAMLVVAEWVIDFHPAVARAAVEAGVADGMAYREGLA